MGLYVNKIISSDYIIKQIALITSMFSYNRTFQRDVSCRLLSPPDRRRAMHCRVFSSVSSNAVVQGGTSDTHNITADGP